MTTRMWVPPLALFLLAGACDIGGGYLVWQWLRQRRGATRGLASGVLLAAYGVVATYQPASFGRVYAAYGGVFIALSLLWAWVVDRQRPDTPDLIGAGLCLAGATVTVYWRRA